MVFQWFLVAVSKVPTAIVITVALTSNNFCTCNLKCLIFCSSVWYFDLHEQLCGWCYILSSVYQWLQCLQCSISLSIWTAKSQSILHLSFAALALVIARAICLHIQSKIYRTGANVFFSKIVVSLPVLVSS